MPNPNVFFIYLKFSLVDEAISTWCYKGQIYKFSSAMKTIVPYKLHKQLPFHFSDPHACIDASAAGCRGIKRTANPDQTQTKRTRNAQFECAICVFGQRYNYPCTTPAIW